jgi:hypothetical protein
MAELRVPKRSPKSTGDRSTQVQDVPEPADGQNSNRYTDQESANDNPRPDAMDETGQPQQQTLD